MRRAFRAFGAHDGGQSLLVIGLFLVVLLGAVALAVDWGYGMTQRRVLQSASDSAALAVGRYLATAVVEVEGEIAFSVHGERAWCEAARFVDANDAFRPSGAATDLTLQFGRDTDPGSEMDPLVWEDALEPLGGCGGGDDGTQIVPADTRYVRVMTEMTYRSLVASVLGQPTIRAAASARAKLTGAEVSLVGPVWPMVRHYDPADFDNPCPPDTCDPTEVAPTTFWSSNEDDVVYGSFKGLIDLSRYSTRFAPGVPQLIERWDQSGTGEDRKPDQSGNCPGGLWDTAGNEDPNQHDKRCSVPNWFYYSFKGDLSLDNVWQAAALPAGQEAPTVLTDREFCHGSARPELAPSCDSYVAGDWVETAYPSGDLGQNVATNMRALIEAEGFEGAYSHSIIDAPGKSNNGQEFGKALVVIVYLWDCGEWYDQGGGADRWQPLVATGDCSKVPTTGNTHVPDRVHLFTAAPFTFYANLVSASEIRGYWGGQFTYEHVCEDCVLNPLANSAFLVPDED